jgi:hypothetical protein
LVVAVVVREDPPPKPVKYPEVVGIGATVAEANADLVAKLIAKAEAELERRNRK